MDIQLHGFANFGRKPSNGDLVAATFQGTPVIGLKGQDQDGDTILILAGQPDPSEAPPHLLEWHLIGSTVGVIEGTFKIEPIDPTTAFRAVSEDRPGPGALLIGRKGELGIVHLYRQTISRKVTMECDFATGGPWRAGRADAFLNWKLLVTVDGRKEPFEIARFPG